MRILNSNSYLVGWNFLIRNLLIIANTEDAQKLSPE